MTTLQLTKRYWGGDEVSHPGSLSLARLHQMARERATNQQPGCVTKETREEDGLPMVTQQTGGVAEQPVHQKLPEWMENPRLVNTDLSEGSATLDSVLLPGQVMDNLQAMGCSSLFPVQAQVLAELMGAPSGLPPPDICVSAPTGCGKTLCYVVPTVTALLNCVVRQVRCIVVVPSRSLAKQVELVYRQVSAHTRVRCGLLCGDMAVEREATQLIDHTSLPLASHIDVVIATPGRLAEHLSRGSFVSLHFLRYLVIDEADKLLTQQCHLWLPELLQKATPTSLDATPTTVDKLYHWLSNKSGPPISYLQPLTSYLSQQTQPVTGSHHHHRLACSQQLLSSTTHLQKLLLSATMTQDPEALSLLQLYQPLLFSVAVPRGGREIMVAAPPSSLQEMAVVCQPSLKPLALLVLLTRLLLDTAAPNCSALCFTNSRETAERLKVVLDHFQQFKVAMVTSDLPPSDRRRVLRQFDQGEVKVLLCSDALARGMDMPGCGIVINYDPPSLYNFYLHRVGRTARAGAVGHAFSLLSAGGELAGFRRMLRVARRPRIREEVISAEEIRPLRAQYDLALQTLRDSVSGAFR